MAVGSRIVHRCLHQDDILNGIHIQAVEATDDSPAVPEHTTVETPMNISPENKAHFLEEKEAIHLILTGIRDDIYSTVDACQTAKETWEAIERFVTIVKQQHKLDEVSYHKLFDILKQYQNEVNELRAEKLARNANPLALVATAQASQDTYYQTSRHKVKEIAKPITPLFETTSEEDNDPEQAQRDKDMQKNLALIAKYFKKIYKPTNNNLRISSNSKNKNVDMTLRFKNDNQSGQVGNQRTINVAASRENVGSKVVQQSGIQCFNCREYGHFAKEYRKPKRVKDSAYHKEKMLLYKQAEQGVPLQAEQYDWLALMDEKVDEQELEAHYSYIAKIQEVPIADSGTDSEPVEHVQNKAGYNVFANHLQHSEQSESVSNICLVEMDDNNVTLDSPDMCEDDIQNEQNDVESDDERVALSNLIANLKLDVNENKKIQKKLKKANTTLAQELKECKSYSCGNTTHTRAPQLPQTVKNTNLYVSTTTGVNHKPTISRPQLRSNQSKDKVPPNNSHVKAKKTQVEVYPRIPSVSHIMKSVTACKDNLNSRTLNANHMTGNLKLLCNFVEKFLGTIRFGNDQFAPILGYGDLVQGNVTINRVYYIEGLNHNLLSVSQFCDVDLEVAFRKSTCFVRDFEGNDLLTGNRGSDLYTISLQESTSSTLLCLMAKATPTQAWLWHRRLSHLNFDYINLLLKKDIVIGLPKLKYVKDQLCYSYELIKAREAYSSQRLF
nr:retrovirus-related Pol polyprotein from transposon TNT 1-94 [Tanacetum cinerariifolium]